MRCLLLRVRFFNRLKKHSDEQDTVLDAEVPVQWKSFSDVPTVILRIAHVSHPKILLYNSGLLFFSFILFFIFKEPAFILAV